GEVGERTGDLAPIMKDGKRIGAVLHLEGRNKPLYVSVGNLITLESAVAVVKRCWFHGALPEPVRLAHKLASAELENR
ncbi:MAG: endonuclease V, partial [Candidatus Bathyarchaeia archaeon]